MLDGMELVLALPPDWETRRIGLRRVVTVPGFALVPDLFIELHPLVPRPEVRADLVIKAALPPDTELRFLPGATLATRTGWPMSLVAATVVDHGGALREVRLVVRYDVLVYAATALVRASSAERYERMRPQILDVLATARPRLRTFTPACIGELWEMDEVDATS